MRPVQRVIGSSLLAAVLIVSVAATALGHECYNASASAQGNLMKATHSNGNWLLAVDIRELIATGSSGFVTGFQPLDACRQDAFMASWGATGLPLVFAVGGGNNQAAGQDGVIAENNPNMDTKLGGDNRGIDHFAITGGAIEGALGAAYGAASSATCP